MKRKQLSDRAGEVIDLISTGREDLARKMTERILVEIPEYEQVDADQFLEMLFLSCRDHVDGFVHYARTGDMPSIGSGSELADPVRDRVRRGIRLDAYLQAFRVGQSVFWDEILERAGDRPEIALEFAGPSMSYIDHVCNRIASLYLHASHRLRSDEERAGRDLLEALLDGSHLDGRQTRMVASLGMDEGSLIAVLRSAGGEAPEPTADSLQLALTRRLRDMRSGCLVVARQDLLVILLGLGSEPVAEVVAAVESALPDSVRCGISARTDTIKELGRAYDDALAALKGTGEELPVIALTETSAYDYLILTANPTVEKIVNPDLLELLSGSDDRAALAETARAYIDSDLSAKQAAEKLFVHPNTLRYRLDQLEHRAGIDLHRITDLIELRIALHLADRARQDR